MAYIGDSDDLGFSLRRVVGGIGRGLDPTRKGSFVRRAAGVVGKVAPFVPLPHALVFRAGALASKIGKVRTVARAARVIRGARKVVRAVRTAVPTPPAADVTAPEAAAPEAAAEPAQVVPTEGGVNVRVARPRAAAPSAEEGGGEEAPAGAAPAAGGGIGAFFEQYKKPLMWTGIAIVTGAVAIKLLKPGRN